MASNSSNAPAPRRFAGKGTKVKKKQDPLAQLLSMGNFLIALGVLLTMTGLICFIPFQNKFSKFMFALGLTIFIVGVALRIADLLVKIIKER